MHHDYDVLLLGGYFCDLIFTGLPEMPHLGAEVYGTGFDMVPGAAFTTAIACRRLGLRVGWSCDFGDDFFSRFVLDAAQREGLPADLFRLHPFPLRQVSVSMSFPHDRSFISFAEPFDRPSPVPLIERHRPRAVLLSSLSYGDRHAALVEAAHGAGGLVYMDCQCNPATLETPGVIEALRRVDIFAPNETEALRLTGTPTLDAALDRLAALTSLVIVKRGAAGALARSAGREVRAPALSVAAFDTTGAGDCFNAGFLYGYLAGRPLEICLRCGNICGGLSTTAHGGGGLPTAARVEEVLRDD